MAATLSQGQLNPRFLLGKPTRRTLRLKFIPEKLPLTSSARFQCQRLAFRGNDTFDLSKVAEKRLVGHRQ
jgi:hypothetical protein